MRRECGKRGAFSRAALPPSFPPLHRAANSAGVRSASTECGLDVAVLDRSSRPDEIQMHTVQISPEIHRLAGELSSVVHGDRPRRSGAGDDHIEHRGRLLSAKCRVSLLDYADLGVKACNKPLLQAAHLPLRDLNNLLIIYNLPAVLLRRTIRRPLSQKRRNGPGSYLPALANCIHCPSFWKPKFCQPLPLHSPLLAGVSRTGNSWPLYVPIPTIWPTSLIP